MDGPRINLVDGPQLIGVRAAFPKIHLGVKIAPGLHVIEQVAAAFIQQIVIERIFFIDRNISFEDATADLETLGLNIHDRTGLYVECVVHNIGFWSIQTLHHRNLRHKTVLFLIFFA